MKAGRSFIAAILLLVLPAVQAWHFVDVDGRTMDTGGQAHLIVFGSTTCPPLDRMVIDTLGPIARDYPDVPVITLFPCTAPDPGAVRAWRARVVGASNLCVCEIRIAELVTDLWAAVGYAQPASFLFDARGGCKTNFVHLQTRAAIELPLARELWDLQIQRRPVTLRPGHRIIVDLAAPPATAIDPELSVTWRVTPLRPRLVRQPGQIPLFKLQYP